MSTKSKKSKNSTTATYQAVTQFFIDALKEGIVGWKKPFFGTAYGNVLTGSYYSGFNPFILATYFAKNDFKSNKVVTIGAVKKVFKGRFLKEAHTKNHCPLVYYNRFTKEVKKPDGTTEEKTFGFLKYFRVYAIECLTDEAKEAVLEKSKLDQDTVDNQRHLTGDQVIQNWTDKPIILEHGVGQAFYNPQIDAIKTPPIEQFVSSESYYSVLFHEAIHATGHKDRLNRPGVANFDSFGSHQYSVEELVAEIGATILNAKTGIETEYTKNNSAAYVNSWIKKLEQNPTWIYKASIKAQKAVEYILGENSDKK